MKIFCLSFFIIWTNVVFSQNDTSKIYNATHYKKGIYKSAKDFLTNNPSIQIPFTYNTSSYRDSTDSVIVATLSLLDSTNSLGIVYGFCDGVNIFIQYPLQRKNCKFHKLQVIDFFSCFTISHQSDNNLGALGNLLQDAILGNPTYDLMQINSQGFVFLLDITRMKMLLSRNQPLLKEFKKKLDEIKDLRNNDENNSINKDFLKRKLMIEYLIKLNKII